MQGKIILITALRPLGKVVAETGARARRARAGVDHAKSQVADTPIAWNRRRRSFDAARPNKHRAVRRFWPARRLVNIAGAFSLKPCRGRSKPGSGCTRQRAHGV